MHIVLYCEKRIIKKSPILSVFLLTYKICPIPDAWRPQRWIERKLSMGAPPPPTLSTTPAPGRNGSQSLSMARRRVKFS